MQKAIQTSQRQTSLFTEEALTSLRVVSHASPSAQPESEKEQTIHATSGKKCLEQFGKFSRATSWQKMFAASLIGMEGWYSTRCRLTWKLRALKSYRFYFQLAPSTLPTEEIGFGLLHTPTTYEAVSRSNPRNSRGEPKLEGQARLLAGMLPTPRANKVHVMNESVANRNKGNSEEYVAKNFLLPTPTRQDSKGKENSPSQQHKVQELAICVAGGSNSQLNPLFVAELMGFPPDYLELPFLDTEKNP